MSSKWVCEKRLFKETWIRTFSSDMNTQITDGSIPGLYLRYSPRSKNISFYLLAFIKTTGQRKNLVLGKLDDFENVDQVKDITFTARADLPGYIFAKRKEIENEH